MKIISQYFGNILEVLKTNGHPSTPILATIECLISGLNLRHGDQEKWMQSIEKIEQLVQGSDFELDFNDNVAFSSKNDLKNSSELQAAFMGLGPWRKGPFEVSNFKIDTEWQSNLKWDRLKGSIGKHDLIENKKILDIGCSSGYYMYRMLEHQPKWVMGVDPTLAFFSQYLAFQKLKHTPEMLYLPVGSEKLNGIPRFFDTVFCMGILYHRKSPFEFIRELQSYTKPGGKLVIETLMVPGEGHWSLTPVDRYARMRNVYTLPTKDAMIFWLEQFGFKNIDWVMDDWTELNEQRSTDWMTRESLKECIDPNERYKTVEGYPAPRRCLVIATAK